MRSSLIVVGLAACSGVASTVATPPPRALEVAVPRLPKAEFTVVPAELADDGVLARIPHRVRIRGFGTAWMREDGEPATPKPDRDYNQVRHRKLVEPAERTDTDVLLPVIGETETKIRVVFHDDDARMALWISRGDTWSVIGMPIQLSDREHHVAADSGVWAVRGAPVSLGQPRDRGWREATVRDEEVTITGYVPDSVITNVWLALRGDPEVSLETGISGNWTPPHDDRPKIKLADKAQIRAAPSASAPVIATIASIEVIGSIAGPRGDYTKVEIARPYATIRGYVVADQLTDTPADIITHGHGSGHGFGMSHADKVDVTAGACLYERVDGDVVGVQTEPSTRLGASRWAPGWSQVHVGTSWMIAGLFVHDVSRDPAVQVWESCTEPAHR